MKEQRIKITSADVYESSFVRLSSLQKYMQQIALEDSSSYGATYHNMRESGMVFVITRLAAEFYADICTDDELLMVTVNNRIEGVTFVREFMFYRNGTPVAAATTHWVLMDFENRRVCRATACKYPIPALGLDIPGAAVKRRIINEQMPFVGNHKVRYTELDENKHLNNSYYSDILIDYLPVSPPIKQIKRCQINFVGEASLDSELCIYAKQNGDTYYMSTINKTAGKTCFEAELSFFD